MKLFFQNKKLNTPEAREAFNVEFDNTIKHHFKEFNEWIKELIKTNNLKLDLKHDTHYRKQLKKSKQEELFKNFTFIFQ